MTTNLIKAQTWLKWFQQTSTLTPMQDEQLDQLIRDIDQSLTLSVPPSPLNLYIDQIDQEKICMSVPEKVYAYTWTVPQHLLDHGFKTYPGCRFSVDTDLRGVVCFFIVDESHLRLESPDAESLEGKLVVDRWL